MTHADCVDQDTSATIRVHAGGVCRSRDIFRIPALAGGVATLLSVPLCCPFLSYLTRCDPLSQLPHLAMGLSMGLDKPTTRQAFCKSPSKPRPVDHCRLDMPATKKKRSLSSKDSSSSSKRAKTQYRGAIGFRTDVETVRGRK